MKKSFALLPLFFVVLLVGCNGASSEEENLISYPSWFVQGNYTNNLNDDPALDHLTITFEFEEDQVTYKALNVSVTTNGKNITIENATLSQFAIVMYEGALSYTIEKTETSGIISITQDSNANEGAATIPLGNFKIF